ncbi:MAG: 2'-5' RNA ligase family protein [Actinomycetia bacterium]|nr:2'-5' RNA ligase family protein [Actinomycetes bacterium]
MDPVFIGQAVFDKCMGVTVASRRDELCAAFAAAGIVIADDGVTVASVASDASFDELSAQLKSSMPTASMTVKRVVSTTN